ncbi:MAG: BlaI/MecI/CopY family transcriptional regulator [Verrucomicrobiaceae bacterium]|nr:BlaI/MecI/CopY family transcriptional regulator [Verrucomicrobiaceae bacterium]
MTPPDITEAEWPIMETLWENSPQTASEVAKALRPTMNWAENTVRTMITRLVEKGALKTSTNASGTKTFLPAVKREACVRAESASFLERVFQGAAKPLLVHFASNTKLTPEEVRELKKLLDQNAIK